MNKKLSKIALDILGIILALICLSPFYIIIVNSFKTKSMGAIRFYKSIRKLFIYNSYKYSIYSTICIYGSVDATKNKL